METTFSLDKQLPQILGVQALRFNDIHGLYETNSYTSAAGNSYYRGYKLSNRIVIELDLGNGWAYTFLNGIRIYRFMNGNKELLLSKSYNCYIYSRDSAKNECINLMYRFISDQCDVSNNCCSSNEIKQLASDLITEAYNNQCLN